MIQVFKTDEDYKKWLDGQRLPSGIVVYVSDDETMYFSTNNIKGELKTYKCEKDEVIQYPPLIYSAKSAGSTITVNGETVTLEQGNNITLDYPNEITSVAAISNTALTYIQIPNTVVSINDSAFTGCTELTDFRYNGTMEQWRAITLGNDWNLNAAFTVVHCSDGDVTLEEPIQPTPLIYSAKSAGSTITVNGETVTLEQGDNITLDYPNEITSVIATDNKALTAITIPNTVTSIGEMAFESCTKLASVTLPEGIKNIGHAAFNCCESLLSITIPEGVTSINSFTFNQCYALASVTLPNSLISIDIQAFSSCSSLVSITIPEGVTSIGDTAFAECAALASVTLPNTLVSIGESAFRQCAALASVTLPNSLISIGDSAFNFCKSLLSITIPNSVEKIDGYALANCSNLTDFNFNGTKAQWASITKGTNWKYKAAFTVVHCTDGDVTL